SCYVDATRHAMNAMLARQPDRNPDYFGYPESTVDWGKLRCNSFVLTFVDFRGLCQVTAGPEDVGSRNVYSK
ncbi:hypothetical protein, partial [Salinisphaera sp.]